MNTIFRYPGGKSKATIRKLILKYQPRRYSEYRDPFVGGGGVFFAVSPQKKRWINDMDSGLVSVYQSLRDQPAEFIAACRRIAPARRNEPDPRDRQFLPLSAAEPKTSARDGGRKLYNARLKRVYDELLASAESPVRWYFMNRTNWAGRVNFDLPSRMYFSCEQGWNITTTRDLEGAAARLRGVRITCGDYTDVLEAEGSNVWIYADPPYYLNSEFSPTGQLYRHNFTDEDHVRFAEAVRRCRHRVCISYDEHPRVRELFDGMWFNTFTTTYCGTAPGVKKREAMELIITNYDPIRTCNIERRLIG